MKIIAKILKNSLQITVLTICCYTAQADSVKDAQLEARLMTVYSLDVQLNPFNIEVSVIDGIAMLNGTVENDIERELAELMAQNIDGILSVDNRLQVDADVERNQQRDDFARTIRDISITARVKSLLLWSVETHRLDVEVATENAQVTLTGTVNSSALAEEVEQITRNINGVRSVINELRIEPSATDNDAKETSSDALISDSRIRSRIITALMFDRRFIGSDIQVSTENGVVLLEGTAISAEQRSELITMARKILGVQEVQHDINVVSYALLLNEHLTLPL